MKGSPETELLQCVVLFRQRATYSLKQVHNAWLLVVLVCYSTTIKLHESSILWLTALPAPVSDGWSREDCGSTPCVVYMANTATWRSIRNHQLFWSVRVSRWSVIRHVTVLFSWVGRSVIMMDINPIVFLFFCKLRRASPFTNRIHVQSCLNFLFVTVLHN
jgi:hypothetical protein